MKPFMYGIGAALAAFWLSGIAAAEQKAGEQGANQQQPAQESKEQQQSTSGASGAAGTASGKQAQKKDAQAGVLVLVPFDLYAKSEAIANGCWVRLYEGKNFTGDQLAVYGPADLADVEANTRIWGFDSVVVGPKATVTTYDEENYGDRNATLKPGQEIADLGDKKLGLFQDIESLRVTC